MTDTPTTPDPETDPTEVADDAAADGDDTTATESEPSEAAPQP